MIQIEHTQTRTRGHLYKRDINEMEIGTTTQYTQYVKLLSSGASEKI